MPKILSSETHEQVDAMIREGIGPTAIAKEARVSIGTVYYRAAKFGTPKFDVEASRWVSGKEQQPKEEAEKVTEMQKRIEQLIAEGVSPDEIRKRENVAKATLQATCERLGVEWIGERWESVRRPEDPGEHGDAGVGDDGPEKTLQQAINDGIDAGLSPEVIAQQEHCGVSEVLALSLTRGLHWHLNKLQWVRLAPPDTARAETPPGSPDVLPGRVVHDPTGADPRPEAPQGAEGNVRDAAQALKDAAEALRHDVDEALSDPGSRTVEMALRMTKRDALTLVRDCWSLRVALAEFRTKDDFDPNFGDMLTRLLSVAEPIAEAVLLR